MSPAQGLDFASVFVFALTGALVASRAQLDIIGFLFIASLTAVGGGTIRDVILRRDQVFWVNEPIYIGVACAAAILVFFTAHLLESRCGRSSGSTPWRSRSPSPPGSPSRGTSTPRGRCF